MVLAGARPGTGSDLPRPLRYVTLNLFHGGVASGWTGRDQDLERRLEALSLSACIGTQPLGTLWLGFLTGRVGAPVAAGAAAAILLMLPVTTRAVRAGRHLEVAP